MPPYRSIIGCLGVGDTEPSQAFLNEISQSVKGNILEKFAGIKLLESV